MKKKNSLSNKNLFNACPVGIYSDSFVSDLIDKTSAVVSAEVAYKFLFNNRTIPLAIFNHRDGIYEIQDGIGGLTTVNRIPNYFDVLETLGMAYRVCNSLAEKCSIDLKGLLMSRLTNWEQFASSFVNNADDKCKDVNICYEYYRFNQFLMVNCNLMLDILENKPTPIPNNLFNRITGLAGHAIQVACMIHLLAHKNK